MEDSSCNDAKLKQRILQLEQERDDLRFDVEQLCMQHAGMPSKVDIPSQIQLRKITGLEQEMEQWKQKLEVCFRKNQKLQDELSEAKHIKAQFADLLKSETDKNLELDKEIKFYQSKAANALLERNQALFQVDKRLEEEKELIAKVHQLQNRLELLTSDLFEQKKRFQDLQEDTKAELEDSKKFQKVVQVFWGIRSKLCDYEHVKGLGGKATILLQDSESRWAFGDTKQELERLSFQVKESETTMAALQEETCALKELVISLQRQLEEETISKQHAKYHWLLLKQKLWHLTVITEGKLKTIHSMITGFKEEINATLKEEQKWAESLLAAWSSLTIFPNPMSQTNQKSTRICTEGELCNIKEVVDNIEAFHEASANEESVTSSKYSLGQHYDSEISDTKEALALALQEKVAALLLLSQQEERHIFEENMVAAWESKVAELQKQLLQVTIDKGKALVQVANLSEELAKAEEERRELKHIRQHFQNSSADNQTLSATWSTDQLQNISKFLEDMHDDRRTTSHWPLKSWFKRLDNFGSRPGAQAFFGSRTKGDDSSLARLKTENASLRDMLSRLQQLCSSVNHLYQIMIEVREQLSNGHMNAGCNAPEQLNIIIAEARHLIVALGGSLPVSNTGWSHEELLTKEPCDSSDVVRAGGQVVSTIGIVSLESLLYAAQLYKTWLSEHKVLASRSSTVLACKHM